MNLRNHWLVDDHYNSEIYYKVTKKKDHIWMFVNTTNDNITFSRNNYFSKMYILTG